MTTFDMIALIAGAWCALAVAAWAFWYRIKQRDPYDF
jgi:hypothetical protein